MERMTKFDKQLGSYVLIKSGEKYTERDLINAIGEREDSISQLVEKSNALIESMMELMEITKGEKEDLMKKIESLIQIN